LRDGEDDDEVEEELEWRDALFALVSIAHTDPASGPLSPSLMLLWFELGAIARKAHRDDEGEMLRRIYGYASWCFEQPSSVVQNAVAVGFYEHVFDDPSMRESVAPWLNERVVAACWVLWEARFPPRELRKIARLVGR